MFVLSFFLTNLFGIYCDIEVNTTHGHVLGYSLNLTNSQSAQDHDGLNIFLGIPFAEPPIGSLRFARPIPKRHWAPGVLKAQTLPPICPQVLGPMRR